MQKVIQRIVIAGIVIKDGKVLIIQRSKDDRVFPTLWEIPGGKREFFETSKKALLREVKEEVGINIKSLFPVDVFEFRSEKDGVIRDTTQVSFLCELKGKSKVNLSSEYQDFAWVKKKDLNKYNLTNKAKKAIIKAFTLSRKVS